MHMILLLAVVLGADESVVSSPPPILLEIEGKTEALRAVSKSGRCMLCLCVDDVEGGYTIPYIQPDRDLKGALRFPGGNVTKAVVTLSGNNEALRESQAAAPDFSFSFARLRPGEYTLEARGFDTDEKALCHAKYERIGIGAVIAAIGDSITEGYYGRGFKQDDLDLTAGKFPEDTVSKDGRNFPQFAPTTAQHLPEVNCFESWMTRLNDLLSASWKQPVFIANEGWGGIASGGYIEMIRNDAKWRKRVQLLEPQVWLIHLGVNDERAKVPARTFAANLEAIVDLLIHDYGASPGGIFVAKPCHDYFEGAREILEDYNTEIDALVARRGLQPGADFFAGYATNKERWYGEDPVHPNVAGVGRMAELWHEALVKQLPEGPK